MNIPFCRSEQISVTQGGREFAEYIKRLWEDAGKKVDVKENSGIITISYTQSGCFTENMNKETDDGASAE
jgi:hypothetical protein